MIREEKTIPVPTISSSSVQMANTFEQSAKARTNRCVTKSQSTFFLYHVIWAIPEGQSQGRRPPHICYHGNSMILENLHFR